MDKENLIVLSGSIEPAIPVDSDASRVARRGLWFLILGLGSFLTWASLAPLDQGIAGSGTVVVAGERKSVQSLTGGTIEQILVQEGDLVKQGQVLVQLNRIQAQAQRDMALGQWFSSRSAEVRLNAERMDLAQIDWPSDLLAYKTDARATEAMALQNDLFKSRRNELNSQLKLIEHEQSSLNEQLAGFVAIKRNHESQLNYQQRELQGMRELAKEGFVPRNRLFETERNAAQLNSQMASTVSDIGRTRQALNEARLKTLQQQQSFRRDAETQLSQVAAEVSSYRDRLKALEFEVANSSLLAPVSGRIFNLTLHTVGGVAPPGQKLMEIVPQDALWVIKAQFPPMVADRLKPSLPVDIKFSSLQHNTPIIFGSISRVAADQQIDEATRLPYFGVEVVVNPESLQQLQQLGLNIRPGMQAEVLVKTGERTLMTYLFKPLIDTMSGAFKEE